MQRLEVSGAVQPIYGSLGVKRLNVTWQALQYHRNRMGCRCINSVEEYNSIHHELQVATYRN